VEAKQSGTVVFDSLPFYNNFGPHCWPVRPFLTKDDWTQDVTIHRCFKAVLLREDGPSVPPYADLCETQEFTILENDRDGCSLL